MKLSCDFIALKRYVGDSYLILRTYTHTHTHIHARTHTQTHTHTHTHNMTVSTKQNIERDLKKCLLSLSLNEISEIFVEEETIESFVQHLTANVSFLS